MGCVVDVSVIVVGVGGEGLEVEFAGGGEDAGGYFASEEVGVLDLLWYCFRGARLMFLGRVIAHLLTTKSRFIGRGGSVVDIVVVGVDGLEFCD